MYFAHLLCSYFNFYFPQNSDPVISCHQRTAIRWKLSKFLPPNLQTYFYLNIIFISVFKMEKMPLLSKVKSHYFALDSLLPQHICSNENSLSCTFNISLYLALSYHHTGYSQTLRGRSLCSYAPPWSSYVLLFKYPNSYLFFPMTTFQLLLVHQFIALCLLAPLKLL